jgi:hypothetical protein
MSLTSLADEEVIRTDRNLLHRRLRGVVERHLLTIAPKHGFPDQLTAALREDLLPLAAEPPTKKTTASQALDSLVRYIPTESITL